MFYYVIYNSSLTEYIESEKKIMTTILYGTILYIVLHAFFTSSSSEFISNLKYYFWLILILDITFIYYTYYTDEKINDWMNKINDLKGTINNLLSNEKKEIKNTNLNPIQSNPIQSNPIQSNPEQSNPEQSNPIQSNPIQSTPIQSNPEQSKPEQSNPSVNSNDSLSTPISSLKKNKNIINTESQQIPQSLPDIINNPNPSYIPRGINDNNKYNDNDDNNKKNVLTDFDKLLTDRNKDITIPQNISEPISNTSDFQSNNFPTDMNNKQDKKNINKIPIKKEVNFEDIFGEFDGNESGSDCDIDMDDFNNMVNSK